MTPTIRSLALLAPILIQYAAGTCDEGWTAVGGVCLSLQSSADTNGFPTVFHAQSHCAQFGADLASLETAAKHEAAFRLMRNIPSAGRSRRAFLGLHDMATDGDFQWRSRQPLNFSLWAPTEPNNNGGDEDCVVVQSEDGRWLLNGRTLWRDYPCCVKTRIRTVYCQRAMGPWQPRTLVTSPYAKKCNIVLSCPAVPVWRDIRVSSTARLVGSVVNYTCPETFVLEHNGGQMTSTHCTAEGVWDPPWEICVRTSPKYRTPVVYPPVEAPGAAAIGTTGMIIMLVELSIVVLADANHLRQHALMCASNVLYLHQQLWTTSHVLGTASAVHMTSIGAQDATMV